MKKTIIVALTGLLLVAPIGQSVGVLTQVQASESEVVATTIKIDGLKDHYHTGDEVILTATADEDAEGSWQWYIKEAEATDWHAVDGLTTQIFSREATTTGLQVKVALLEANGDIIQESEAVTITINDHHAAAGVDPFTAERIYKGFFYNDEVQDRELSDWDGDWKSVYPLLESGELDEVFEAKAAKSDSMTAEEYKTYYTTGYQTDIDRIVIKDDTFTFFDAEGNDQTSPYTYDGVEILTYERGNRGVRFVFKRADDNKEMPAYIQFSDHGINPNKASHYHLYWGDDRQALLDEVDNWPTYYPSDLTTEDIIDDMLAH